MKEVNLKSMKKIVLFFLLCSCQAQKNSISKSHLDRKNTPINIELETDKQNPILIALEEAMMNKSYSGLIEPYKLEKTILEDDDPTDDFVEQKVTIYANVIENFNGINKSEISYYMILDSKEEVILNKEKKIVCLCEKNNELFWPGTGSSFPNQEIVIKKANELKGKIDNRIKKNCLDY